MAAGMISNTKKPHIHTLRQANLTVKQINEQTGCSMSVLYVLFRSFQVPTQYCPHKIKLRSECPWKITETRQASKKHSLEDPCIAAHQLNQAHLDLGNITICTRVLETLWLPTCFTGCYSIVCFSMMFAYLKVRKHA